MGFSSPQHHTLILPRVCKMIPQTHSIYVVLQRTKNLNTKKYHTGLCLWYFITLTLNFCSSVLDIVSALAIIGMILTFVSSFFIQTRSIDFNLKKGKTLHQHCQQSSRMTITHQTLPVNHKTS